MNKMFIRVRSVRDIAVFVTLIAAGCILIYFPMGSSLNIVGYTFTVIGCFLVLSGMILAFMLKTRYMDLETGNKYYKKEKLFQQTMYSAISSAIADDPETIVPSMDSGDGGIRLDIYYSRESGKAYLQLNEYDSFDYEPCSGIFEHDICKVEKLLM